MNLKNKISDSNKENMTPSSYISSNSKVSSFPISFTENNIKSIRDKKEATITQMEMAEAHHNKLLSEKEELSFLVVEKDSILFKEKSELEYLSDILKDRDNKKNYIKEEVNSIKVFIENEIISQGLFNTERLTDNKIVVKLHNDYMINGIKDNNNVAFNGFFKSNSGQSNISNEIFEREYYNRPQLLKYFAAYNIA